MKNSPLRRNHYTKSACADSAARARAAPEGPGRAQLDIEKIRFFVDLVAGTAGKCHSDGSAARERTGGASLRKTKVGRGPPAAKKSAMSQKSDPQPDNGAGREVKLIPGYVRSSRVPTA